MSNCFEKLVYLESNFEDFEYDHTLNREEVQHSMRSLFEVMHFQTKEKVQHAFHLYHVSKRVSYKTQLSN